MSYEGVQSVWHEFDLVLLLVSIAAATDVPHSSGARSMRAAGL